jgi:hypothetical protein
MNVKKFAKNKPTGEYNLKLLVKFISVLAILRPSTTNPLININNKSIGMITSSLVVSSPAGLIINLRTIKEQTIKIAKKPAKSNINEKNL